MYQTILFDLDGTLTNPALGITNSLAYALEKFNIEVTDKKELYRFIGPPLQEILLKTSTIFQRKIALKLWIFTETISAIRGFMKMRFIKAFLIYWKD